MISFVLTNVTTFFETEVEFGCDFHFDGEPFPVGVTLPSPRQTDQTPGDGLQALFQKPAVVQIEKLV